MSDSTRHTLQNEPVEVIRLDATRLSVRLRGQSHEVTIARLGPGRTHLLAGARSLDAIGAMRDGVVEIGLRDLIAPLALDAAAAHREEASAMPRDGRLVAPIAGRVARILVSPGERVAEGQGVAVLEAMKMENELRSPRAGTVAALLVEAGAPVERGTPIATIEA